MSIVLITAVFAAALAFILGTALGFFRQLFAVQEDPVAAKIREVLPGANCGACGYPGCESYAVAVAGGKAQANVCTVGGPSTVQQIAAILGIHAAGKDAGAVVQTVAVLACQGTSQHTPLKGTYTGQQTCRAAKIAGGTKFCAYGCLGFGDCVNVCMFDALSMGTDGLPVVDYAKCTGCGLCMSECPQKLLVSKEKDRKKIIAHCSNRNPVKQAVAKSCKVACLKCGLCVKFCPEHCINLDTHIPVIDSAKCTLCGTCVEKCPKKVLRVL